MLRKPTGPPAPPAPAPPTPLPAAIKVSVTVDWAGPPVRLAFTSATVEVISKTALTTRALMALYMLYMDYIHVVH